MQKAVFLLKLFFLYCQIDLVDSTKESSSYRVHKFDACGGVSISSAIQGRVYRDTDAPNMTPCRTRCIVITDTDPG